MRKLANGALADVVRVLLGSDPGHPGACVVEYTHASKTFRLLSNNKAGSVGPALARSGNILSNAACRLHLASSYGEHNIAAGGSARDWLTLILEPLSLSGENGYYVQSSNASGTISTGWQLLRTIQVGGYKNPSPSVIEPRTGNSDFAVFSASFPEGSSDHYLAYILLLPTPNVVQFVAKGSCLIEYNRISKGMRLVDDPGTHWIGPLEGVPIGKANATLSNSACTADVANAAAEITSIGTLTVRVPVRLKASLGQVVTTFAQGFDVLGRFSDMRQFGTWQNPLASTSAPGPRIQGRIAALAGETATVETKVSHTSGLNKIGAVHVRLAGGITDPAPCHYVYFPLSNALNLVNDAQSGLIGPDIPVGTNKFVSNQTCGMNANSVAVIRDPQLMTITMPIQIFQPGPRNLYLNAFDTSGWLTHWVEAGSAAF